MKNASDGLISRPGTAKERVTKLEDRSITTFQTKMQRQKRVEKHGRAFKNCGTISKSIAYM